MESPSNTASGRFETHKFELACYIDGVKKIHPVKHSYSRSTGEWLFVFQITPEQAEHFEAEFLASESKSYDSSVWYFKKSMGPRRRGER